MTIGLQFLSKFGSKNSMVFFREITKGILHGLDEFFLVENNRSLGSVRNVRIQGLAKVYDKNKTIYSSGRGLRGIPLARILRSTDMVNSKNTKGLRKSYDVLQSREFQTSNTKNRDDFWNGVSSKRKTAKYERETSSFEFECAFQRKEDSRREKTGF